MTDNCYVDANEVESLAEKFDRVEVSADRKTATCWKLFGRCYEIVAVVGIRGAVN